MEPFVSRLKLGHGPRVMDVFLALTCPHCKRAFEKLDALVRQAGEDAITVHIRMLAQPWHIFSAPLSRCVLAAVALDGGARHGMQVLSTIYEHQDQFVCERHSEGPNMELSPASIISKVIALSGVDFSERFASDDVHAAVKWYAKFARQNGIHVSPTFCVSGLVNNEISSRQSVEEWLDVLEIQAD